MGEFLKTKLAATGLAIALGVSACGSDGNEAAPKTESAKKAGTDKNIKNRIKVPLNTNMRVTYFPDGTREINGRNVEEQVTYFIQPIYEWCESGSRYSQVEAVRGSVGSLVILPHDPACADGKLTPTDFKVR